MEANFDAVWSRVTGADRDSRAANDNRATLEHLISMKQESCARYGRLVSCIGSPTVRRLFSQLAEEEREQARRLQAAHYLLLGDSYTAVLDQGKTPCPSALEALRERYTAEGAAASAFEAAASGTRHTALRNLYTALAQEERRHEARLWELAEKML